MREILVTWVGSRDPSWRDADGRAQDGPILSLLATRAFDTVYLLCTIGDPGNRFAHRAAAVLRAIGRRLPRVSVRQYPVALVDVSDYREVYRATNDACQHILRAEGAVDRRYSVFLSPGTPQMQTVWVLLVQSGLLPATMIAAPAPQFARAGEPSAHVVDLSLETFPQVVDPGTYRRKIGVLEAQVANLHLENARLAHELRTATLGTDEGMSPGIPEGFQVRTHLAEHETYLYRLALDRAGGKSAAAARLLGISPHAFRKRAAELSVRPRRARRGET